MAWRGEQAYEHHHGGVKRGIFSALNGSGDNGDNHNNIAALITYRAAIARNAIS